MPDPFDRDKFFGVTSGQAESDEDRDAFFGVGGATTEPTAPQASDATPADTADAAPEPAWYEDMPRKFAAVAEGASLNMADNVLPEEYGGRYMREAGHAYPTLRGLGTAGTGIAAAAAIPGAQTFGGTLAAQGILGAAAGVGAADGQSVGDVATSGALGLGEGALGGALGYGIGGVIGKGVSALGGAARRIGAFADDMLGGVKRPPAADMPPPRYSGELTPDELRAAYLERGNPATKTETVPWHEPAGPGPLPQAGPPPAQLPLGVPPRAQMQGELPLRTPAAPPEQLPLGLPPPEPAPFPNLTQQALPIPKGPAGVQQELALPQGPQGHPPIPPVPREQWLSPDNAFFRRQPSWARPPREPTQLGLPEPSSAVVRGPQGELPLPAPPRPTPEAPMPSLGPVEGPQQSLGLPGSQPNLIPPGSPRVGQQQELLLPRGSWQQQGTDLMPTPTREVPTTGHLDPAFEESLRYEMGAQMPAAAPSAAAPRDPGLLERGARAFADFMYPRAGRFLDRKLGSMPPIPTNPTGAALGRYGTELAWEAGTSVAHGQDDDKPAYASGATLNYGLSAVLASGDTGLSPDDERALTSAVVAGDDGKIRATDFRLRQRYPGYARRVEHELRSLNEVE